MSTFFICFIGMLAVLLEATWLHQVAIFETIPNLSIILVVHWSILQGCVRGRRLGLWIGLLEDFLFHKIVGFYSLFYYLLGHLCGLMKRDFSKGHFILPLMIVTAADLFYGLLHYMLYGFFQGNLNLGFYLKNRILPEMFYSAIVSLPIYFILLILSKYLDRIKVAISGRKEKEL